MFQKLLLALGYVRLVDHGLAIDDDGIARPVGEKLPEFSFMQPAPIAAARHSLELEIIVECEEAPIEAQPKFLDCDTLLMASPSFRPPPS